MWYLIKWKNFESEYFNFFFLILIETHSVVLPILCHALVSLVPLPARAWECRGRGDIMSWWKWLLEVSAEIHRVRDVVGVAEQFRLLPVSVREVVWSAAWGGLLLLKVWPLGHLVWPPPTLGLRWHFPLADVVVAAAENIFAQWVVCQTAEAAPLTIEVVSTPCRPRRVAWVEVHLLLAPSWVETLLPLLHSLSLLLEARRFLTSTLILTWPRVIVRVATTSATTVTTIASMILISWVVTVATSTSALAELNIPLFRLFFWNITIVFNRPSYACIRLRIGNLSSKKSKSDTFPDGFALTPSSSLSLSPFLRPLASGFPPRSGRGAPPKLGTTESSPFYTFHTLDICLLLA